MRFVNKTKWMVFLAILFAPLVTGCTNKSEDITSLTGEKTYSYPLSERLCLERVIFFEANRSSREGLIAVGTVVMNRVNSSRYPKTICAVVGQPNQFAPGALTRPINLKELPDIREAADAVLRGERHPNLKNAMFFHTAGLTFPYRNMHYTLVAGGNAFYEKRGRDGSLQLPVNDDPYDVAYAFAQEKNGAAPSFDNVIIDGTDTQNQNVAFSTNSTPVASLASQQVAINEANPVISKTASNTNSQVEIITATREHSSVLAPAPVQHSYSDDTVVLSYVIPEARKTDVIGDMLLRQYNEN